MKRAMGWTFAATCLLVVVAMGAAAAPYRVLIVDGTQTLEASIRVGAVAGAIRQTGLAEVAAIFASPDSPYADPLAGRSAPAAPYDLVMIVPRGIGDGTWNVVWLLVAGNPAASPDVSMALSVLGAGMSVAFGEGVRAAGPLDELWAALTASLYVAEGWLRPAQP